MPEKQAPTAAASPSFPCAAIEPAARHAASSLINVNRKINTTIAAGVKSSRPAALIVINLSRISTISAEHLTDDGQFPSMEEQKDGTESKNGHSQTEQQATVILDLDAEDGQMADDRTADGCQ